MTENIHSVFLDIAHQSCYILFIQSKGVADIPSGMQFEIDYSMRRHPYQMRQQDFYCGTSHSKGLFLLHLHGGLSGDDAGTPLLTGTF